MPRQLVEFSRGLVTARDPSTLKPGELAQATNIEYRKGSPHVHKINGRQSSGAFLGSSVIALHRFRYETGDDKIIAYTEDGIFESDVFGTGDTSSFVGPTVAGLSPTAIPSFANIRESWIMVNGSDGNRLRQSNGVWRPLGLLAPAAPLSLGSSPVQGTIHFPTAVAGGTYTDAAEAYDDDLETFAYGKCNFQNQFANRVQQYTFSSNLVGTNRSLHIVHSGYLNVSSGPLGPPSTSSQRIDITASGGGFTYTLTKALPYDPIETVIPIPTGIDLTTVTVTFTTTPPNIGLSPGLGFYTAVSIGRVFELYANDNASDQAFTTSALTYGYTERYIDHLGIPHESNMSPRSTIAAQTGVFGINLTGFPTVPENSFATEYVLYRSLDEVGGGFPFMYEIATIPIDGSTTSYVDIGSISFTDVTQQQSIYTTLNVLYPDGGTLIIEPNGPPPLARQAIAFDGCMVYLPVAEPRIYYSLPASIAPAAIEAVPALYFLEFATPHNDFPMSAQVANSGKSLIVYFERYTMLITRLPQAHDPGVFDQRIREYVSNIRGAVGVHATAEITIASGRTLSAAVDAIGLWVTDGISEISEWSIDLDWPAITAVADMPTLRLYDNPQMDRLEMQFLNIIDGKRYEYHFFYGQLKDDVRGGSAPLVTGPNCVSSSDITGVCSRYYYASEGQWVGLSGGCGGDVYTERAVPADESMGSTGVDTTIPMKIVSGDFYLAGLGRSVLVTLGYPKFSATDVPKNITFTGHFKRDGSNTEQLTTKVFNVGTDKVIYWHRYCDRHRIEITDNTDTTTPSFVGYELEVRDAGGAKE